MFRSRKHMLMIVSMFLIAAVISGCSSYGQQQPGDTVYNAQYPYSPEFYQQFLDKEIQPVTNQLTTQCMLAQSVIKGTYHASDAYESAKDSIDIVQDCIDNVDMMIPAEGYEDRRTAVLELMENAKSSLETYKDELSNRPIDKNKISKAKDIMQADYIYLTNEFNTAYK